VGTFTDLTTFILNNQKIAVLEEQAKSRDAFQQLIGKSSAMQKCFAASGWPHKVMSPFHSPGNPAPVLIDVRTPHEFAEVHIPEARNIPLSDLHKFVEELKGLSQERPLTLICRTHNRVKIAYEYLTNNGIANCGILEGGITDWVNSGKPVIRGRKGISLEGQVWARAEIVNRAGNGIRAQRTRLVSPHPGIGRDRSHPCRTDRLLFDGHAVIQIAYEPDCHLPFLLNR